MKPNVEIETYDDHRMAMAFSLVACCGVPVVILDPGCTRKTFPDYFSVSYWGFEGVENRIWRWKRGLEELAGMGGGAGCGEPHPSPLLLSTPFLLVLLPLPLNLAQVFETVAKH